FQTFAGLAGAFLGVGGLLQHACEVLGVAGGFLCRGVRGALGLALQGAGHVGGVAHGFSGRFAVVGLHFLLQALQGLVHLAGVAAQGAFFGLLEGLGGFAGAVDGLLDACAVKLGVGQFLDALG